MDQARNICSALDELVAVLRLEQNFRLATVLHQQLHQTAWPSHSELFSELGRLLRSAQASAVSNYTDKTRIRIDNILSAIQGLV
jgi:hypothetical protein